MSGILHMFGWDLGRVMTAAVERRGEGSTAAHQRIEYAKLAMTMLGYTVSVYCVWKTYVRPSAT